VTPAKLTPDLRHRAVGAGALELLRDPLLEVIERNPRHRSA
jgi:hypothetical protein